MFECPRCQTGIPKWKAVIMTNSTKIKCENCGVTLKPDRDKMQKVARGGIIAGLIAVFALRVFGVGGLIFAIVIGLVVAYVITINTMTFEIDEPLS